jgi:hypothetical protein
MSSILSKQFGRFGVNTIQQDSELFSDAESFEQIAYRFHCKIHI